jgi:glucose-6-phosphate 1-dehydrogenase
MVNPFAEELSTNRRASPCAVVIFGATGDLTHRKLVPSLLGLAQDGLLPPAFAVVGFARREKSHDSFRSELLESVQVHARGDAESCFLGLRERFSYVSSDFHDPEGYYRLRDHLSGLDKTFGTEGNRLFYLATPPSAYATVLAHLSASGLSGERGNKFARVIVEKPFGRDLQTARDLNEQVAAAFEEHQVFRIDHYLGKETVQNILALRFANSIFEPLWSEKFVDHVQITVAESIGVEGRGGYFEEAGIIRDMIQNHLLQILSLIAMEPPVSKAADAVRDEKVKVLRAIRSLSPEKVVRGTVRGTYTRGFMGAREVPGYREEHGVARDSETETYAAIRLSIDNWRWAGTPFFLRAGKRLPRRVTEVAIHFKMPPHLLYADVHRRDLHENVLLLRIQPDEGISLGFGSKVPGPDFRIRGVRMDFRYGSAFGDSSPDAYERLLLDAMIGDSTLFARRDEVEEAWRIVDSIVAGWRTANIRPEPYSPGSWGPPSSASILENRRAWRKP